MTESYNDDLARLKQVLEMRMPQAGLYSGATEGFHTYRGHEKNQCTNCFNEPLATLVVQGSKRSILGSEEITYQRGDCLVAGLDMPTASSILEASPERPFLSLTLKLDGYLLTQLAAKASAPTTTPTSSHKGIAVSAAGPEILNAFLRLLELQAKPEHAPVLGPLIVREIHYLLLIGPLGEHLRPINTLGTRSNQVVEALAWLKQNYTQQLQVDELARMVNMATSTFHRHFRQLTTLSPLQYQKKLRLHEAQRLMLTEGCDAAGAALAVGYESPTQFNREYKRLFGAPPRRDINRLR